MSSIQCNLFPYKNCRATVTDGLAKISELCSRTVYGIQQKKIQFVVAEGSLKFVKDIWNHKPTSTTVLGAFHRSPTYRFFHSRNFSQCNFNGQSVLNYRHRALQCRRGHEIAIWTQHGQKRHFFFGRKIKKLTEEADKFHTDPEKQSLLLKELNKTDPFTVVKRFESGRYANNEETTKEYIKALVRLNLFDNVKFSDLRAASLRTAEVVHASAGEAAAAPSSEGAAESSGTGGAAQAVPPPTGNMGVSNLLPSDGKPVPVRVVTGAWGVFQAILTPIWYVLIFVLVIKWLFSGDRETISLFDVPTHHDRVMVVDARFDDVKGCDEAKAEMQEIVEYLRHPTKFTEIGAQLPKGLLLVGLPGTGKTLLARAVAGEAGVPFFYCSGSSFDEIFVGVGSKRVRSLFEDAKRNAPCIIFIDEIDAVGGKRSKWHTSTQDGTLQQLLTELDGFEKNEGIIVIAATNMPDLLDPALIRPGRFDKQVVVPVPDVKGRKEILDLYLSKIKAAPDVDSQSLARATVGLTGADLSQLINLAAIKAVIQGKKEVTRSILEETRDDVWMGRMRKSALVDEKTKRMTAYHEGGHALVALFTEGANPIHRATIIQRGHALGMVSYLPEGDQLSISRKQMLAQLSIAMAGRAAEELVYGHLDVSSGASSDFQQATTLAYNMVTKWGMSDKLGCVYLKDDRKVSPDTMQLVDDEVKQLLERQYQQAMAILVQHRHHLDTLALALIEHETLDGDEIKRLLNIV